MLSLFSEGGAASTEELCKVGLLPLRQYAAPADGRTIATGLTVLAWTAASVVALRGLSLRPAVYVHTGNGIRPEIHVPAPAAPAEETPDNVHPLQTR